MKVDLHSPDPAIHEPAAGDDVHFNLDGRLSSVAPLPPAPVLVSETR